MILEHPFHIITYRYVPAERHLSKEGVEEVFAPCLRDWGLKSDEEYIDVDSERLQLKAILNQHNRTAWAILWIPSLDQLADNLEQFQGRLYQLRDAKLDILSIDPMSIQADSPDLLLLGSSADSSNQHDILMHPQIRLIRSQDWLDIYQRITRKYRQTRIRHGHEQNRFKGLPPPGRAPYGYRRGKDRYVIDRRAAAEVKDFFEYFLLYGSLRGAVRFLEQAHQKKISPSTGQRWLTHPVYRGDLLYQNAQILSDTHKPLLTRREAAQVDRLLRRNHRLPSRSASAPRSLAGLVFCDACGNGMSISKVTKRRNSREYLYLRPKSCPLAERCSGLSYAEVLRKTVEAICKQLPLAVQGLDSPALGKAKQELEAAMAVKVTALEQIPALVTAEVLDEQTAQQRSFKLNTELSALRQRLTQLPPVNLLETSQAIALPAFWFDLSETERRFYFREFIQRVLIQRQGNQWQLGLEFIFGAESTNDGEQLKQI